MIVQTGLLHAEPGLTGQRETREMTGTGRKGTMGKERKILQHGRLVRGLGHQVGDHDLLQEGRNRGQGLLQEGELARPLGTMSVCPRLASTSHAVA